MSDALDNRARRAAQKFGYIARKSRWRRDSIDNYCGLQIIEPRRNLIVAGRRFEMTAQDIIECARGASRLRKQMTDTPFTAAERAALSTLGLTFTGASVWAVGAMTVEAVPQWRLSLPTGR